MILQHVSKSSLLSYLPARIRAQVQARLNSPVYPTLVQIEPTRRCNLRCVMCTQSAGIYDPKPDMPLDFFKRILVQFPDTLETVNIQGVGEPLLNTSIVEMIEFARQRGLRTRFNTNLTLLTDEMAERLVRCGHSEVQVSMETTDPDLYASIRRGAKLERVLKNIERLRAAKERNGSQVPEVTVHALLIKAVLPTISAMVCTLRELGVRRIHFADLQLDPHSRSQLSDGSSIQDHALPATMSEEQIWKTIDEIKSLQDDSIEVSVPGDWGGLRLGRCLGSAGIGQSAFPA